MRSLHLPGGPKFERPRSNLFKSFYSCFYYTLSIFIGKNTHEVPSLDETSPGLIVAAGGDVERGGACGYSGNVDAGADTCAFEARPIVMLLGSLHDALRGALRQCLRSLTRGSVDRAVVDVVRLIQPVWYREGESAARGGE